MAQAHEQDPALDLILKWRRRGDTDPDLDDPGAINAARMADPVAVLIDEARLHGHPVNKCSAAYKWWRYRQSLMSLIKRWRRLGLPRDYKRELERELRMTMALLAAFYYTCGEWYRKRMEEEPGKRWRRDLYAALVDAAKRFTAYLEPCRTRAETTTAYNDCVKARIELALEGARHPDLVYTILEKHNR